MGRVGIEPTTSRLKAECSTSELTPPQESARGRPPRNCRRHDTEPPANDKVHRQEQLGPTQVPSAAMRFKYSPASLAAVVSG